MRASEFITETINPECLHPQFHHEQEFDGLLYKARVDQDQDNKKYFIIEAFDGNERVGIVRFKPYKNTQGDYWLTSLVTSIHPKYQGKGIARTIYAYAKMLGNTIKPSKDQTPQGQAMWKSWQDSGDAEHLLKEYKKYPTQEFEGVTFTMIEKDGELIVKALNDFGNAMGHVVFNIDGKELDPQDLQVDDKYQGQGVARVMYDYIKSCGFIINRSYDQTDAGAGFWNKHRGEDVRVWEDQ